jgi:hypothetical protein
MHRAIICLNVLALLAAPVLLRAADKITPAETEFFEKKVRPLLVQHCYQCHSAKSEKIKGELLLDTAQGVLAGGVTGPAIVPGKPEQSLLIKAVRWTDKDTQMPPKARLSDEQVAVLVQWVKMGAPDPRHEASVPAKLTGPSVEEGRGFWAFQPVRKPVVPAVKEAAWPRGEIDRFILAALEGKGIKPARDADPYTLIRRVTFDLTGLPPTSAQTEAFVRESNAEKGSGAAYARLVDHLLASPQFGERWGRHWLDVVRFAESTGMTRNYPYPHAWRYRDYVIDSFNSDKPYNRFVMEQIAGDLLQSPGESQAALEQRLVATGFLALGPKDLNEKNALQYTMDNVDEQIDVLSRSMLGLTVSCARCHDHKFDPIPTADYYALAGIFRSTQMLAGYSARQGGGNKRAAGGLIALGDPKNVSEPADDDADDEAADALRKQLAAVHQQIKKAETSKANLKPGKAKGKDLDNDGKADKAEAREQNLSRRIADLKMQADILQGRLKKLEQPAGPGPGPQAKAGKKAKNGDAPDPPRGDLAMGVREGKPTDSVIFLRGEIEKPGKAVSRGLLQVLTPSTPPAIPADESGRLQLAQWVASPNNPLTSRAMVNRVWQHLFGQGLVRSVDNFGATGEKPSNAKLLDYLAARFSQGDAAAKVSPWSVKALVREVVMSRTYQLSSAFDEASFNQDADNRLNWRQNQRRLEVEAVRDAMLQVSGKIELSRPTGSPVSRFAIAEINNTKKGGSALAEVDGGPHRSVYMPIVRSALPGMYELFDFAEPSMVTGERDVTTVATQALYMMNSAFVIEQSKAFAQRLLAEKAVDDAARIDLAYRNALGRSSTSIERQRAARFIAGYEAKDKTAGWAAFCQALLACAEFRYLN